VVALPQEEKLEQLYPLGERLSIWGRLGIEFGGTQAKANPLVELVETSPTRGFDKLNQRGNIIKNLKIPKQPAVFPPEYLAYTKPRKSPLEPI